METVAENCQNCGTEQCERTQVARRLCHALGAPGPDEPHVMNKPNWIKNNHVMSDDMKRAFNEFGKDLAHSKGHTMRHQPLKCHNDAILMPKELKVKCDPITLHMDSLVISGRAFLASVGKLIYFQDAQVGENKKKDAFCASYETI